MTDNSNHHSPSSLHPPGWTRPLGHRLAWLAFVGLVALHTVHLAWLVVEGRFDAVPPRAADDTRWEAWWWGTSELHRRPTTAAHPSRVAATSQDLLWFAGHERAALASHWLAPEGVEAKRFLAAVATHGLWQVLWLALAAALGALSLADRAGTNWTLGFVGLILLVAAWPIAVGMGLFTLWDTYAVILPGGLLLLAGESRRMLWLLLVLWISFAAALAVFPHAGVAAAAVGLALVLWLAWQWGNRQAAAAERDAVKAPLERPGGPASGWWLVRWARWWWCLRWMRWLRGKHEPRAAAEELHTRAASEQESASTGADGKGQVQVMWEQAAREASPESAFAAESWSHPAGRAPRGDGTESGVDGHRAWGARRAGAGARKGGPLRRALSALLALVAAAPVAAVGGMVVFGVGVTAVVLAVAWGTSDGSHAGGAGRGVDDATDSLAALANVPPHRRGLTSSADREEGRGEGRGQSASVAAAGGRVGEGSAGDTQAAVVEEELRFTRDLSFGDLGGSVIGPQGRERIAFSVEALRWVASAEQTPGMGAEWPGQGAEGAATGEQRLQGEAAASRADQGGDWNPGLGNVDSSEPIVAGLTRAQPGGTPGQPGGTSGQPGGTPAQAGGTPGRFEPLQGIDAERLLAGRYWITDSYATYRDARWQRDPLAADQLRLDEEDGVADGWVTPTGPGASRPPDADHVLRVRLRPMRDRLCPLPTRVAAVRAPAMLESPDGIVRFAAPTSGRGVRYEVWMGVREAPGQRLQEVRLSSGWRRSSPRRGLARLPVWGPATA